MKSRSPNMVPTDNKKTVLHQKLQQLRNLTKSNAVNKTSIIIDASNYIQNIKHKIGSLLNQDIDVGTSQQTSSTTHDPLPMVNVEIVENKGFVINVLVEKNCPGLLVSILEAFEEVGLHVIDARVSCSDTFQLEAIGGDVNKEGESDGRIDAEMVKEAVLEAIHNWTTQNSL